MPSATSPPVDRRRFLLELWLEPRAVTTRGPRLRGRITELRDGDQGRGVASIQDVEEYIRAAFAGAEWEIEP